MGCLPLSRTVTVRFSFDFRDVDKYGERYVFVPLYCQNALS
jgi:hypothetical protein